MIQIIKHSWLIFKKTPGYIHSMTTFPIMMLLLVTFLLAYSNNHNITVIDHSTDGTGALIYEAFDNLEGFKLINIAEEEAVEKMMAGNIEMVVILEDKGAANIMRLSGETEIENTVKTVIKAVNAAPKADSVKVSVNEVAKKSFNISNSMGLMLFKFITASSAMAALLIRERNNGMRGRIFLSGMNTFSYLSGKALIQLMTMLVTALVYYVFCLIFQFDFGMRNTIYFFLMIIVTNLFSTGVFVLLSSILKEEGSLWSVSSFIFFPMAVMAGAMFPFSVMPQWMQRIGSYMPQRWITGGIEAIQKYDSIIPALPYIGLILGVSVICYGLGVFNTGRKRGSF